MAEQGGYWTLAETVTWIRTRELKAALPNLVVCPIDSETSAILEEIRQACREDKVRCVGYPCEWPDPSLQVSSDWNDRIRYSMRAGRPRDHAEDVPSNEWIDLEFARDAKGYIVGNLCRKRERRTIWRSVQFLKSDVVVTWPGPDAARPQTEIMASGRDTRRATLSPAGRPPRYDWYAFYCEVIRIANIDGLPERPELTKLMKQWCCDRWGEEPADSLIRFHISKIYAHRGRVD